MQENEESEEEEAEELDRCFLLMWDEDGLDCLLDVTKDWHQWRAEIILVAIGHKRSSSPAVDHALASISIRARFNGHRHCEAYALITSLSETALRKAFAEMPQEMSKLVRAKGVRFVRGEPKPLPAIYKEG